MACLPSSLLSTSITGFSFSDSYDSPQFLACFWARRRCFIKRLASQRGLIKNDSEWHGLCADLRKQNVTLDALKDVPL